MFSWPPNSSSSPNRPGGGSNNYQQHSNSHQRGGSSTSSHGNQVAGSGGGSLASSFHVPQLRWLPSVLSRNNHLPPDPAPAATPNNMPNQNSGQGLRNVGQQPQQQGGRGYTPTRSGSQQQSSPSTRGSLAISNVVDAQPSGQNGGTGPRYPVSNGRSTTTRTTRAAAAAAAKGTSVEDPSPDPEEHGEDDADREQDEGYDGEEEQDDVNDQNGAAGEGNDDRLETNLQQQSKRLKTNEEICLFQICNRHGATFGERNKICEWWRTITEEFTKEQGHPYSWHSVRRKVESVTKQRMRVLAEQKRQREQGQEVTEDKSDPAWRTVLDAWIPHWERFEEAERKRIEVRDSYLLKRKRKREAEAASLTELRTWQANIPSPPQPAPPSVVPQPGRSVAPSNEPPYTPTGPQMPAVKLPAGYGAMFARGQFPPPVQPPPPSTPLAGNQNAAARPSEESPITLAVLETLNKLNKHLDQAAAASSPVMGSPADVARSESSPIVAALAASKTNSFPASPTPNHNKTDEQAQASFTKLKEEIRTELRDEFRNMVEEKFDSLQRTQEMILEMLRQEPQ